VIERRLNDALGDMSHWNEFDFAIINDDLDTAVAELEGVLAGRGRNNRVDEPELAERIKNILV
jgi:guanylate kinase